MRSWGSLVEGNPAGAVAAVTVMPVVAVSAVEASRWMRAGILAEGTQQERSLLGNMSSSPPSNSDRREGDPAEGTQQERSPLPMPSSPPSPLDG
jgi:hypothetical protein